MADTLINRKAVRIVEKRTGLGRKKGCCPLPANKEYSVISEEDRTLLFKGVEELDRCCQGLWCFCQRDFEIKLMDNNETERYVLTHRTLCCSWFNWCQFCNHYMDMRAPSGQQQLVGRVGGNCHFLCECTPSFSVYNNGELEEYKIGKDMGCWGKTFPCCPGQLKPGYVIRSKTGTYQGTIQKVPNPSANTNEDEFMLVFPENADGEMRALLIAATFLLDYALFDNDEPPKSESMVTT